MKTVTYSSTFGKWTATHPKASKWVVGSDDSIHGRSRRSRQQSAAGMQTNLLFDFFFLPKLSFCSVVIFFKATDVFSFLFLYDIKFLLAQTKWKGKLHQAYLNL